MGAIRWQFGEKGVQPCIIAALACSQLPKDAACFRAQGGGRRQEARHGGPWGERLRGVGSQNGCI